jgi:hypothetical protein
MFSISTAHAAILVVSVKGDAAYSDGAAWKPMAKGQTLREGTRVSTGVNSQAVLNIDDNILTVKPMTMIKVYRNSISKEASENSVGLKYGSVNAKVKKLGTLKTKFNITTPIATSSVRGTEQDNSQGPGFGNTILTPIGVIGVTSPSGINMIVEGKMKFNISPDSMRPGSLLSLLNGASVVKIYSDHITIDEKDYFQYFGDQLIDDSQGIQQLFELLLGQKAVVTGNLIWP